MTKSQTLPPDITVTRADVLALPSAAGSGIICLDEGRVWKLWRMGTGRVVWMEVPEGTAGADVYACGVYLSQEGAAVAERAFLWQTALASDAALADIGNDPAPSAPPTLPLPALAYLRREARMVEPGDESWRNRVPSIRT